MDAEEANAFQQKLNQWIANQGFWFQLRHSLSGGGNWSNTLYHLFGLAVRLVIALVVLVLVVGYFIVKRVDTEGFEEGLEASMAKYFQAEKVDVSVFSKSGGEASIHRVGGVGTSNSFFRSFEIKNLRFKMKLLDGVAGVWNLGTLDANSLDLEVRSGLSSQDEVEAAEKELFGLPAKIELGGLRSASTNISWGYYQRAFGNIANSQMTATRSAEGWRCVFKGGTFTQNWIRECPIEEMVVSISPKGVTIERGVLFVGDGRIEFQAVMVQGAELPAPSGTLKFVNVPVEKLLPRNARSYLAGSISGALTLGGSTNSSGGITLDGTLSIEEGDQLAIRDDFRVFEALSVADYYRTYKRVVFQTGRFHLSTGGGKLSVEGIDLQAENLMTVSGEFSVRRPTDDEIKERSFGTEPGMAVGANGFGRDFSSEGSSEGFSLKNAGKVSQEEEEPETKRVEGENTEFYDELAMVRKLREEDMNRALNLYFFDGKVDLIVAADAFERSAALKERFPVDPETQRTVIPVELKGGLSEIGVDLADEILDSIR
ncbi:hypothetical protein HNR46_002471 [Haloferula luteola]|uniref:Uncharacterized protein n=1 Tax=Haloferula luteola TaxID=595692 RepID=A0A840VC35_9BACT|nr:hypothetical protein [Haloferula luteola]MBB5352228.1 hypothetical protein [Haloferula luteola]